MRTAIFGGTFDPIHNAHLVMIRQSKERFGLDLILVVPAAHPPHKRGVTHAPYADRVRMAEIACEDEPGCEVSRLEEGTARSYSIDTIEKVRKSMAPRDELFFIIGADAFAEIETWYRWYDVVRSVTFIVVSRPHSQYSTPAGARVVRLDDLDVSISSSDIRRKLEDGDTHVDVPASVIEYIRQHNLYLL